MILSFFLARKQEQTMVDFFDRYVMDFLT